MTKKKFFTNHAKSSAALISLGIHAILIVVALFYVAVTVIKKDDVTFEATPVKRPQMPMKKLQVPMKVKKIEKPKLRKNIVAKPTTKSMEIRMPEMTGIKGGLGAMGGDGGLGNLGFNLEFNLFGGDKGSGNELQGTFYDLKANPDGTPNSMQEMVAGYDPKAESKQNDEYIEVIKSFSSSWTVSRLEKRYFKAPASKFATCFMLPSMSASEAPKAYGVADVVKPKRWVAYYNGKFAAPATGRYRFWGIADDVMMVRVRKDLVIDASFTKQYSDWDSKDPQNRTLSSGGEVSMVIGDWFHMTKGKPTDIEVLIGEMPGGHFYCRLLIEQDDVEYPKGTDDRPILPVFKTADIPEKLIPQMKIDPDVATLDGPNFGLLK